MRFLCFHAYLTIIVILNRSGTVNVIDVSDYDDPLLNQNGQIGIILNDGEATSTCRKWVNQQYCGNDGGELRCPLPCPPTFVLLEQVARGDLIYRYERYKDGSRCVFNTESRSSTAFECCYRSGVLVDTPEPGAGRAHRYHPRRNRTGFEVEEAAYRACCDSLESSSESCQLFYSLRPPCRSNRWERRRPKLSMFISIFCIFFRSCLLT